MRTTSLIALAALALSGLACDEAPPEPARPAAAPAPTNPANVDLGPPQGPPIQAQLADAPNVPPPIQRKTPARVVVKLEVKEVEGELADGVKYTFWTFGGKVPGKFIRVRQGDMVELHLFNAPGNKMPHNIDLHAVTGPGGGAQATFTAPGHETEITFKATRSGLFVYHCATAPVGMHIANGMYGMILVEPPEGLPPVDHEYYVMQGDFYTTGKTGQPGLQSFDIEKAVNEQPTYVLFNGREGSLTGANALKAKVGETVRLFVGNGGPNLVSSFHVIGQIFAHVYPEGARTPEENVQTTLIPSGGAAIVDFKAAVPGTYSLVDHSIFRAFNKGAIGQLVVSGPEQNAIFSTRQDEVRPQSMTAEATPTEVGPLAVDPKPSPNPSAPSVVTPPPNAKRLTLAEQMADGQRVFTGICAACHQADAHGLPNVVPPLAGSDFLMKDRLRAAYIVTHGLTGPVTVNGKTFNSQMPPLGYLSDQDIANVLTFVRNSFGNKGPPIKPDEVTKARNAATIDGAG